MNSSPRLFGSLVGLLAGYFISVGIYEMMLIGNCTTPPGPGEVACPSDMVKYFFYLFFGIIGGVVGTFLGGSWLSFSAIFAGVGVGAIRAGTGPEAPDGSGWYWWFGLIFLASPLFMVVSAVFVGLKRIKAQRLLSSGQAGTGTVLAIEDTGVTVNGNPRVRLRFLIEPSDGITPPFEATKTTTVSRVQLPRVGDRYPVWFDPDDRDKWMFAMGPGAEALQQPPQHGLRQIVEAARRGAQPGVPAPQTTAVVGELNRLNELRLTGKISAEEFASRTADLLRGTPV
jgi:hypothetical protein